MDFNRILNGMLRAARLDKSFYEEVEHDASYSQDALGVVILVSLVGALGGFIGGLGAGIGAAIGSFILQVVLGIGGYYLWVFIAHWVGTQFFKGQGDMGEVQRALGFAYAPRFLNILSFIPCLNVLIGIVAWIWSIAAGFVAIKQSLDQDDTNAILTMVVSAVVVFVITLVLTIIFGGILGIGAAVTSGLSR
ncbi:MAG: YIP1 family protein [Chloroflexi bacterium]|nr:YIP1 family protein [Chloroflexota bacterium]